MYLFLIPLIILLDFLFPYYASLRIQINFQFSTTYD